jgi:hypothetical protein
MLAVWIAAFFAGIIPSRIATVAPRSGIGRPATALPRMMLGIGLGGLAVAISLSLAGWGFASLPWYLAVGLFLAGHLVTAVLVTPGNWLGWYRSTPILEVIAVAGGLYLWICHWPFA